MKIRTIKPEFWVDEKLSRLPIPARLMFIGLWNLADDNGVFRSNSAFVKSQIFPYDTAIRVNEVDKWLSALVEARMIEPFSYEGESFSRIRTFRSHQKVDPRYKNELISREIVDNILLHSGAPLGPHRAHGGATPQEVEVEVEVDSGADSHTHGDSIKQPSGACAHDGAEASILTPDEERAFRGLTERWLPSYAPNVRALQPLTATQYKLLRKSYYLADIARVLFVISGKLDTSKVAPSQSVYATLCTYLTNDRRVIEQRQARDHNARLTPEGLARGTCQRRPVPRTTRVSNPELGYIFDYET